MNKENLLGEKIKVLENELALKNRELEIEAALEKVRVGTMAMKTSEEIGKIIYQLFSELKNLGVVHHLASISTDFELNKDWFNLWYASDEKEHAHFFRYNHFDHPINEKWKTPFINGDTLITDHYSKKEKDAWYDGLFRFSDLSFVSEERKNLLYQTPGLTRITTLAKNSFLSLMRYNNDEFTEEDKNIVIRFGTLFEQSYTRFLDLKRAEAQAREAQIETALEKVRSRSLAMHKSDELQEVVTTVLHRLNELGIAMDSASINLPSQEKQESMIWIASKNHDYSEGFRIPFGLKSVIARDFENILSAETDHFFRQFSKEEKDAYYRELFERSDFRHIPQARKDFLMSGGRYGVSGAVGKYSGISAFSYSGNILNSEEIEVLKRFLRVFEQAYIRFLDLQKAEAQAREAQIETALEKVRSRSLAMHKSDELQELVTSVSERFNELGIETDAVTINIFMERTKGNVSWAINSEKNYSTPFHVPYYDCNILRDLWDAKEAGDELLCKSYSDEEKNEFWKFAFEHSDYKNITEARKRYLLEEAKFMTHSTAYSKNSSISIFRYTNKLFSEKGNEILQRFARVFEQAYVRFLDLQKAEKQAREAIKQASLDRVRGEIASMRTVDDLQRITPIIWHELTALGVPFVRCGVFIIDEATKHIQVHLSSPNGSSLGALKLPYNSSELTVNAVNHWRQGIIFKTHWNKQDFLNFMQSMIKLGQISSPETYQGATKPPESLHLHFVPFKQGMLYAGNTSSLEKEALELVKSLAESFSIAYARYEDFRQLEEAKNQIEKTFTELKATQAQLIQSEKMASLGELTAGIAHEIQNPLNFVNNFSEVSRELISEMNEELAIGNWQLAKEISSDIDQNLEKINHHGKRASSIVKGMLQHSRTSTGQKEPTDINALADEYLRLSYHGLRAKDKSFNADFKTEFDPNLPKAEVIPQDIGRVLLNLINNAFYAVSEKQKTPMGSKTPSGLDDYKPAVTITTKNLGDKIEISVKDNGPGIPEEIKNKIFQPFFTTKPTGEGTGLGLSLSYDIIVKVHGGEIKVKSALGAGTEFIIVLPK